MTSYTEMYGQLDGWDLAETPAASFVVRPTKPRSPHLRRHIFLFATVLVLFLVSAFVVTRWVMPASRVSRPWQIKTTKPCSRAILGKDLVTDEYGYTCSWQDSWMQPSGCCDQSAATSKRFTCDTCDATAGCCGVYEICVSCCLREDNLKAHFGSDPMKQLAAKDREVYQSLQDPFELCQMVCRTSSHSLNNVDGSAVFRSESLKYCYNAPTYASPTFARAAAAVPGHSDDPQKAASLLSADDVSTEQNVQESQAHSRKLEDTTTKLASSSTSNKKSSDSVVEEIKNDLKPACITQRATKEVSQCAKELLRKTQIMLSEGSCTRPVLFITYYLALLAASFAFMRL